MYRFALLLTSVLCLSCSDSPGAGADASLSFDAALSDAPLVDANLPVDAALVDAASMVDAATPQNDADLSLCHQMSYGSPAVTLEQVTSLPEMTGGQIPLGAYDAVAIKMITQTITAEYHASWFFEDATTMQLIEQLGLNGNPPPVAVPKTLSWATNGTSLAREQTCGGDTAFANQYTIRTVGPNTFLDVRQATIMFTFKKR